MGSTNKFGMGWLDEWSEIGLLVSSDSFICGIFGWLDELEPDWIDGTNGGWLGSLVCNGWLVVGEFDGWTDWFGECRCWGPWLVKLVIE